jgi:hypothetical protein
LAHWYVVIEVGGLDSSREAITANLLRLIERGGGRLAAEPRGQTLTVLFQDREAAEALARDVRELEAVVAYVKPSEAAP